MKKALKVPLTVFVLFLGPADIGNAADVVHWSGTIKAVNVLSDGIAYVFFANPSSPNPAGSTWTCADDFAYLGNKLAPPEKGFLSLALTAYTTKANVRFGIRTND